MLDGEKSMIVPEDHVGMSRAIGRLFRHRLIHSELPFCAAMTAMTTLYQACVQVVSGLTF